MAIEMKVKLLALDPSTNSPVVILKDEDEKQTLPIWIGLLEASAIATYLEGVQLGRPMTHDLMSTMIKTLGGKVEKIVVTDIADNTYYARIHLDTGEQVVDIDARPSDSIALALKLDIPIFVEEKVLEQGQTVIVDDNPDLSDEEKMKEFLENLDASQFKYKM